MQCLVCHSCLSWLWRAFWLNKYFWDRLDLNEKNVWHIVYLSLAHPYKLFLEQLYNNRVRYSNILSCFEWRQILKKKPIKQATVGEIGFKSKIRLHLQFWYFWNPLSKENLKSSKFLKPYSGLLFFATLATFYHFLTVLGEIWLI